MTAAIQAITQGIHHTGLTVPNLTAARAFFIDALGFEQVGDVQDYPAVFLSDGVVLITLWQARDPASAIAFDRHHNIGLHHLAFKVADLDAVHAVLAARDDVTLEFAPEPLGTGPTRHLMCAIPGAIRIEFIAPANG
jgi:catechol 2,3-dioxygenase-like lactoylglutathione lyase family enzyme